MPPPHTEMITLSAEDIRHVCRITTFNSFEYDVPMAAVIERILDSSIRRIEAWELVDIALRPSSAERYGQALYAAHANVGDLALIVTYCNHERDSRDSLTVDLLQVIQGYLNDKGENLALCSTELQKGAEPLVAEGKTLSLTNDVLRVSLTTENPHHPTE